jgi:meiosis-specific protein HOP1
LFRQKLRPQQLKQTTEQVINQSTSLRLVTNLLETGIGCISYLRGLFDESNFIDHSISVPKPPSINPNQNDKKKNNVSTVKVKKLSRGITTEADQLLDYLVSFVLCSYD